MYIYVAAGSSYSGLSNMFHIADVRSGLKKKNNNHNIKGYTKNLLGCQSTFSVDEQDYGERTAEERQYIKLGSQNNFPI